jgi:hypothetical protein
MVRLDASKLSNVRCKHSLEQPRILTPTAYRERLLSQDAATFDRIPRGETLSDEETSNQRLLPWGMLVARDKSERGVGR